MVFSNVIVDVTVPRRSSVFSQSSVQIQYSGKHYKQLHGTAMGSPVSVVVAEIVMQNIEEQALASYKRTIPLWLRYVDDTFTTLHKDEIDDFHEHLNRQNAHIQFAKEIEDNGKIGNAQSRAKFFRHSAVLSLPAVLLRKLAIKKTTRPKSFCIIKHEFTGELSRIF